jgi:hypothetical protein
LLSEYGWRKNMASAEEVYREAQERLHRTLGAFLIVKAWEIGVDCIAIKRNSLLKFLKLERMKNTRIDWLKEDLSDFFPHQWVTYSSDSGTYATLYLSRFEIPDKGKKGSMTDKKRIEKISNLGVRASIIKVPNEKDMISSMALLSNGILTPKSFGA